jgi:hypothetical protein
VALKKISHPQLYPNCDTMDKIEYDVITKSSEENHVQTVQLSQENICSNMISEQEDVNSESYNPRTTSSS